MKKAIIFAASLLVGLPAAAYERGTHNVISAHGASRSVVYTDPSLLADLGYGDPNTELFPSSGSTSTAQGLIGIGAVREDDLTVFKRPFNHFYDPQFNNHQGRGLDAFVAFVGHPSPDWAIEDRTDVLSISAASSPGGHPQLWSYRDGQRHLLNALVMAQPNDRRASMGAMFESLGHVVHHIQDMAQPQHTRNDTHRFSPANWYEHYTEHFVNVGSYLTADNYPIPGFETAREYWTNAAAGRYRGMADFTAQNYVSHDTGFRTVIGTGAPTNAPGFPLPNGTNLNGTPRTIEARNVSVRLEDGTFSAETMDFVVGNVFDEHTNAVHGGKLLASGSLLDRALVIRNRSRIFTMSSPVFDDNYPILLPRAEAFSAGLINHFFRGRLNIRRHGNPQTWTIDNLSGRPVSGTFNVLHENSAGVRNFVSGGPWTASLGTGGTFNVSFAEPPAGTRKLVVVFQGRIGSEPAAPDSNWFAAAGKVINYTLPPVNCAGRRLDEGSSAGVEYIHELGTGSGSFRMQFEAFGIPDALVVRAGNSSGPVLLQTNGLVSGFDEWSTPHDPVALGTTKVHVRVNGNPDTGTWWELALGCPGENLNGSNPAMPKAFVQFRFGSALQGAMGSCSADFYIDSVFRGTAYASSSGFGTMSLFLTKGPGHYGEFRNFRCDPFTRNILVGADFEDSVPGHRHKLPKRMNQTGLFLFDVH